MKKMFVLSFVLLTGVFSVNAQLKPSLKGVKEKIPDKINTEKVSGTGDKADKVAGKANGEPAYDPDSPTYRAFSIVRDEINSTKSVLKDENWNKNIEGRNDDATGYLKKAKENLTKLQNDPIESKKPYVKDLAASWDEVEAQRKAKFDSYSADKVYANKLEEYHRFATAGWGISDKTLEPSYTGYNSFKKEFETTRPEKYQDSYMQKQIADIDNYFKVEVYKVVPQIESEVDGVIKRIHEVMNGSTDQSYMLNAKHYLKDFEEPMAAITYNKTYLLEDKTSINAVQAKIDKEKAMLEEYINSGKYDAYRKKYEQAVLDAVRVGPKKMSNPKYEGMASSGIDKGKATRVSITSDIWLVKKDDYGYPQYKYLPVDIVVNLDGKCWLAYGQIRKEYEGGGQYGGEFFNYWGLQEEMNCANVNK